MMDKMTKEDYEKKINELKKEYKKLISEIDKEFALSNSDVKVGDIITDHIGSIKVEHINVAKCISYVTPECVYRGACYTKKGRPYKSGEIRDVWQRNLKKYV